jgi:hypothetical protein
MGQTFTTKICATNIEYSIQVASSRPGKGMYPVTWTLLKETPKERVYGWRCPCEGFSFGGDCRHVAAAATRRCGWNQALAPADVPQCPRCQGPVVEIRTQLPDQLQLPATTEVK